MPAGESALTPLANVTLGSDTLNVTFSSISQSYRDLLLVMSVKLTSFGSTTQMRINGITSGYNFIEMYSNTSTATGTGSNGNSRIFLSQLPTSEQNSRTQFIVNFFDYATSKQKTILDRASSIYGTNFTINSSTTTSGITSISIQDFGGTTMATGSTFALYGVSA